MNHANFVGDDPSNARRGSIATQHTLELRIMPVYFLRTTDKQALRSRVCTAWAQRRHSTLGRQDLRHNSFEQSLFRFAILICFVRSGSRLRSPSLNSPHRPRSCLCSENPRNSSMNAASRCSAGEQASGCSGWATSRGIRVNRLVPLIAVAALDNTLLGSCLL